MITQMRRFPYSRPLLLNALYDAMDQVGAKLVRGDSAEGTLHLKMPDGGVFFVKLSNGAPCEITIATGLGTPPDSPCEREVNGIHSLFSQLEAILANLG